MNDWQMSRLIEFLNILEQCKGLNTSEDNLFWVPDNQGVKILSWFSLQKLSEIKHTTRWLALKENRESQGATLEDVRGSQGAIQGDMSHLVVSQTGCTHSG